MQINNLKDVQNLISEKSKKDLLFYQDELLKWQKKINLISPKTIPSIWKDHVLDSARLYPFIQPTDIVLDMGSGAGFPGLVLAMMGVKEMHLVESDTRKCLFLKHIKRSCCLENVIIHHQRIEKLEPFDVDVVTARAVSDFETLFNYAFPFLKKDSQCVFLKGSSCEEELTRAEKKWIMDIEKYQNHRDFRGSVFIIHHLRRKK